MNKLTALITATVVLATVAPALAAGPLTHVPGRGDHPQRHPRISTTYECKNEMGYLRRVHDEQLLGIEDEHRVSVVPVCEGDYGMMRNDGNAGALRQHIADNIAMVDALQDANFRPDDVVGVRMTGDHSVILYVHTFLYR
jgi:hypothetical protein